MSQIAPAPYRSARAIRGLLWNHRVSFVIGLMVAAFAWQFVGLRHMNSDDNSYQLRAMRFFADGVTPAALWDTVTLKPRLRLFNTYIEHGMGFLQETVFWYDFLNISCVLVFLWALGRALGQLFDRRIGLVVVMAVMGWFPLHFYYTIPQSYPVEFLWAQAAFWFAAAQYDTAIRTDNIRAARIGLGLFFLALNGQEYNLVVFPALLVLIGVYRAVSDGIPLPWRLWRQYALVFLCYVGLFVANYLIHPPDPGVGAQRLTLSLDVARWTAAIGVLIRTSVLPIGLVNGISIKTASPLTVFPLPDRFDYCSFVCGAQDWLSMAVVFGAAALAWYLVLGGVRMAAHHAAWLALLGTVLALIPAMVVTVSAYYQQQLLRQMINGHVSTFMMHCGSCLLLVAALGWLHGLVRPGWWSQLVLISAVCGCATIQLITFRYNTTNRQLMNAAMQRWSAVHDLAAWWSPQTAQATETTFSSQTLQTRIGVAGAPTVRGEPYGYWSAYARQILHAPVAFAPLNPSDVRLPRFEYTLSPTGNPVSIVQLPAGSDGSAPFVLISRTAQAGVLWIDDQPVRTVAVTDWQVGPRATVALTVPVPQSTRPAFFVGARRAPALLVQWALAPFGNVATEFGMHHP